jgi:hypothetical protein
MFCLLHISIRLFIKDVEVANAYNAYFSSGFSVYATDLANTMNYSNSSDYLTHWFIYEQEFPF